MIRKASKTLEITIVASHMMNIGYAYSAWIQVMVGVDLSIGIRALVALRKPVTIAVVKLNVGCYESDICEGDT